MSNLSNIGFPVKGERDVNDIIISILPHLERIPCQPHGFYFKFEDESGAQIYLQTNPAEEIIGFNPAFRGESRRRVKIEEVIERDTSELDGAFYCVSIGADEAVAGCQLVFDSPDFRTHDAIKPASLNSIGITAFASNDFEIYEDEDEFRRSSGDELELSAKSFIPSGLVSFDESGGSSDQVPPQAHAIITGEITEAHKRRNGFTGESFYCFVVETAEGFIDVVSDPVLVKSKPSVGGIAKGSFWLSGKIL